MTKRVAFITLILLFIFTIILSYFATQVRVDYEFEKFFPASSNEVSFYDTYRERFETDNDFIMLGIRQDSGVFNVEFLTQIKLLIDELSEIENVEKVNGGTSLKRIKKEPLSGQLVPKKLLNINSEKSIDREKEKILVDPMLVNVFFSKDGKNINLIIKHKERLSKKGCDVLVANIKEVLVHYNFQEYHMVGRAIAQSYYVNLMSKELIRFSAIGAFLVVIFLFISYRNLWSIIIPLSLVAVSAVWTIGLMTLMNKPLDILLVVLPTLIFIVGISDVIHLYTKFLFLKRLGMAKRKAILKTVHDVGLATLSTSLTTSIGFASLYFVKVPIIQEFGLIAALGVVVTFIVTFSGFIAFLSISSEKYFSKVVESDFWKFRLNQAFVFSLRKGKTIFISTAAIVLISLIGISKIEQKNKLLEELPENSLLLSEINYFNEHFVGTRPFEMSLEIKDHEDIFKSDILVKINKIDQFLLQQYGVEYLISPSMLIKKVNLDIHNGDVNFFNLPDAEELSTLTKSFDSKRFIREMKPFIDRDAGIVRLSGRVEDYGSEYFKEKDALLYQFFIDEGLDETFNFKLTGSAYLIDRSNAVLSSNLLWGLFAAFALISLLIGIISRSLKTLAVVMLVNIVPLIGIAGIMGFLGINLKISTSVIFTIAFGIAVDDAIHFMSKYRLALREHKSHVFSLRNTYLSTGRAIVVTTIILIVGFFSLLFSEFLGTYYIGLLVSGTLVLALITVLFVLPPLLYIIKGKDKL